VKSEQIEGRRPVLEALRAGRSVTEVLLASGAKPSDVIQEIARFAERRSIPIRMLPRRELEARARTRNPQGVIALAAGFAYTSIDHLFERAAVAATAPVIVALDGITDPQNLGAVARSAEAAGAHGLIVPTRRSAGVTEAATRASAGALEHLPVVQVTNLHRALGELKERGVWIVALDSDAKQSIYDVDLTDPVCLVIGSEGDGLSRLTRDRADHLVRIPMAGRVGSLNASAAGAVVLFELRRQRG
jgi:23S rRNA (guanosine2251-2'-O)-methyltransferase